MASTRPDSGPLSTRSSGRAAGTLYSSTVSPSSMRSPPWSGRGAEIRSPLTNVPLLEPRSSTTAPSSSRVTRRCRRETCSSASGRGSASSRPRTISPSSWSTSPESGPLTTRSRGPSVPGVMAVALGQVELGSLEPRLFRGALEDHVADERLDRVLGVQPVAHLRCALHPLARALDALVLVLLQGGLDRLGVVEAVANRQQR